jgi:hypothetical protein
MEQQPTGLTDIDGINGTTGGEWLADDRRALPSGTSGLRRAVSRAISGACPACPACPA